MQARITVTDEIRTMGGNAEALLPSAFSTERLADYFELTKPKIAAMALVTVAVGYLLGGAPSPSFEILFHTLIGTALVAAGGSALNHWLERRADGRMIRTRNRPLPAGRMQSAEVFAFGITLALAGVIYLAFAVPNISAAIAAAATVILYVAVYTPLKRVSAWNTVVGAVPGALPPVIGWCAARADLTSETLALFLILFVWQLPHFFSIAWLHRHDYARGGMRMLPNVDRADGFATGLATVLTCFALIGVAVMPFAIHSTGLVYLIGSLLLGGMFLDRCARFAVSRNDRTARAVLRGSLLYLMGAMTLLVADGLLPRYLG
jgi:protoheme IX farnesyltransferase